MTTPDPSAARSPESYEREIRSLSKALSDECANSYRLAQELATARGGSVYESAQRILADDGTWTKGDALAVARYAVASIEEFRARVAEASKALAEGDEAVVHYLRGTDGD